MLDFLIAPKELLKVGVHLLVLEGRNSKEKIKKESRSFLNGVRVGAQHQEKRTVSRPTKSGSLRKKPALCVDFEAGRASILGQEKSTPPGRKRLANSRRTEKRQWPNTSDE